jgi:hypothetical protein
MTVDPKVFAIATLFMDQLLAEINPPPEYAFSTVERNAYIEQTAKALQQAIEDEMTEIREYVAWQSITRH